MFAKHVERWELEEAARLAGVVIKWHSGAQWRSGWRFRLGLATDKRWQRTRIRLMREDGQPCLHNAV